MQKKFIYHLMSNSKIYNFTDIFVCVESEEKARLIHPRGHTWNNERYIWQGELINGEKYDVERSDRDWTEPDLVIVERIGIAEEHLALGIICAEYHG